MKTKRFNPFAPGPGTAPPLLAGREKETGLLIETLRRLQDPRIGAGQRLGRDPLPPIRICGPRGVGKTVLLAWARRQARKRGVPSFVCAYLREESEEEGLLDGLAASLAYSPDMRGLIKEVAAPGSAFDSDVKQGRPAFDALVRAIVAKEPLLLTLDEVHHFDVAPLRELLRTCQKIIAEGLPLALVMAATPGLDRHLRKADPAFLDRSEGLYINLLSDAAVRDAMRVPLEQDGFIVNPDALEAMAAQADNYPYFAQLMGKAVWGAAEKTGVKTVDVDLVAQIAAKVRRRQNDLHSDSHEMLAMARLLPHAIQVMELLERGGGVASAKEVFELLAQPSEEHGGDPEEIHDGLQLDGFIWTVDGETRTGRPSLFDYFKRREEEFGRFM